MKTKELFEKLNTGLTFIPSLSIKSIKKYRGHDGMELLQGDLFINNKKVAFIGDDSHGGEFNVESYGTLGANLHDTLVKLINDKEMVAPSEYRAEGIKVNYCWYLSELMTTFDLLLSARRVKKTSTLFYNPTNYSLGKVKAPRERLSDAWIKKNVSSDELILSDYL